MRQRWPALIIALVVLSSHTAGTVGGAEPAAQQSAIQSVTRPAAIAAPRVQAPRENWETRTRLVTVDLTGLPDRGTAGSAPAIGEQVRIDLFDGQSVQAVFERFDPNMSGVTWVGRVPGTADSRVTIVYGGGSMAASVVLPDASYTIRPVSLDPLNPAPPAAAPLYVLAEINPAGFPREAAPLEVATPEIALDKAADVIMADSADVIELLVVYTGAAEAWAGGPAAIVNWINLGVSETNSAYATSGVAQRVELLHAERVSYTEVSSLGTNLTGLRAGSGVGLGGVPALREAYAADLVSMIVRPTSPDACGVAFLMSSVSTAFAPNGFSVVDAPCVSPGGTFAHELGHNMGLRHDWYMDAGVTPFTYAHGYVSIPGRFRTIMSYPDSCNSLGIVCSRLLAFSNPDVTHNGVPMGVAGGTNTFCPTGNAQNMSCDADERRALNNTAPTVANFRQATTIRPPSIVGHPVNQAAPRGQTVTLQVAASGLGPFSYQWYRGQSPGTLFPITGATGPTYAFVPGSDGIWSERSLYWARVSNAIGGVNSFAATITLLPGTAGDANPRRSAKGQSAVPPPRTAVAPTHARTATPPAPIVRHNSSAAMDVASAAVEVDSSTVCSAKLSILLALAELAERSGVEDLTTLAWVLRTQAVLATRGSGCGGGDR
jgi:hypothetical protein